MTDLKYDIIVSKDNSQILSIKNFSLAQGKINFLLGESGIGKTMISKSLFGIIDPEKFHVTINEIDYKIYLKEKTTIDLKLNGFFVFQEPSTHLNPLLKIGTQLKEGNLGTGKNEHELLKKLWRNSEDKHYLSLLKIYPNPYRPSGGEKQRFLLVMALKKIDRYLESKNNVIPLFIFDEPTGSLDDELRNWFLEVMFEKYNQKPFTILFITHDYSIISEVVNKNPKLQNYVIFKELLKNQGTLKQHVFDEQNYLNWVSDTKNSPYSSSQQNRKCLLTLNSEVKVFNKNIKISNSKDNKNLLKIHKGEIVYLKAPSGMGKTTIAKIIMGLIKAKTFEFSINGEIYNHKTPIKYWKNKLWGKMISMTFQHADEALNLNSTVRQTLMNLPRKKRPKSRDLMQKLKLVFDTEIDPSFLRKRIRQLSGGQKQRINLLRVLLLETPLLILDEPLNGLDFSSIQKIIRLIIESRNSGTGILIISHNEEIMESIVDKGSVYYLYQN